MAFNQVDIVILIITVLSSAFGLWRGLIKEVLSLLTWIAALLVSRVYSEPLAEMMTGMIENDGIRYVTAFAVLFVIVMMLGDVSKLSHVEAADDHRLEVSRPSSWRRLWRSQRCDNRVGNSFLSPVCSFRKHSCGSNHRLIPYGMAMIEKSQVFIGDMNSVEPTP